MMSVHETSVPTKPPPQLETELPEFRQHFINYISFPPSLFHQNTMPKPFRNRYTASDPLLDRSAYLSLLSPTVTVNEQPGNQPRVRASPVEHHPRSWLAVVENRPSWTGERSPTRKLVKDMNGSCRPSSSQELSDSDAEKEKGVVRRQLSKLRELYRRGR